MSQFVWWTGGKKLVFWISLMNPSEQLLPVSHPVLPADKSECVCL